MSAFTTDKKSKRRLSTGLRDLDSEELLMKIHVKTSCNWSKIKLTIADGSGTCEFRIS